MELDDEMALAAYALHERRAHDDPWHELATGTLTRDEAVAMRRDIEPDDVIEQKLALFGPEDGGNSDQTLELLLGRYLSPSSEEQPGSKETNSDASVVSMEDRARRRWWSTSVVSIVALAAAVLLVWFMQRPESPESPPTLPAFELRFDDGWSEIRGVDDPPGPERCDERYHRDHGLSVRLSPTEAPAQEIRMAILAEPQGGEARWLAYQPPAVNKGVITFEQQTADLGLSVGTWTLTFYVSAKGVRHDTTQLEQLSPGRHPGVTVVRGSVCIVE